MNLKCATLAAIFCSSFGHTCDWSDWMPCSATCGDGFRVRSDCHNKPQLGRCHLGPCATRSPLRSKSPFASPRPTASPSVNLRGSPAPSPSQSPGAPNAECTTALPISCGDTVSDYLGRAPFTGRNTCAGSLHRDSQMWYTVTAPPGQLVVSTLDGADFDTVLTTMSGECGNLQCITTNDDYDYRQYGQKSKAVVEVTESTLYYIMIYGFRGAKGTFNMTTSCLNRPTASPSPSPNPSPSPSNFGIVYTWGRNDQNQLGTGCTSDVNGIPTAVEIPGQQISSLSLGYSNTAAISAGGDLYMWGENCHGQLGTGDFSLQTSPIQVYLTAGTASAVKLGKAFTIAIVSDGQVNTWGANERGQLGIASTIDATLPTPVPFPDFVAIIAAGFWHAGAVTEGGILYLWGANDRGQLGNGATTDSSSPLEIYISSNGVQYLSLGGTHSGAISRDGLLYMWGGNEYGQLGTGGTDDLLAPTQVSVGDTVVISIALGGYHSAAIINGGYLYMWGSNGNGQLGIGNRDQQAYPILLQSLGIVSSVALGDSHSGAIVTDGTLYMWGSGNAKQLGNDDNQDQDTPVPITFGGQSILTISFGGLHSGAVLRS